MSDTDPASAQSPDFDQTLVDEFEAAVARRGAGVDRDLMPEQLCRAVVDVLGVDGAAISVYLGGDVAVPVGANDPAASMGEALQFTVREGPCFESYRSRRPVLISDLRDSTSTAWTRWPTYAAQLTQHTAFHGVFAFPLLHDGIVLGSLSLYRRNGGPTMDVGTADAIAGRIADRLAVELFTGPEGESSPRWLDSPSALRRRLVWQAQGLTSRANSITPGEAIDLLRAQAYSADRPLDEVAGDIMSGSLPVPDLPSDH